MHVTVPLDGRPGTAEGDLRLPRPPGIVRRFWARHPWATDSIVAGLYLILATITVTLSAVMEPYPPWAVVLGVASTLVAATALLFRRHRPFIVLTVMWGVTLAMVPLSDVVDTISIPLALYALAVYGSTKAAWIGFAGSVVVGSVTAALWTFLNRIELTGGLEAQPLAASATGTSTQSAVLMLIAVLVGINVGNRKRYVAALVERAGQLARERDQQAIIAAASERARIAREMHDIVSHSLTVMVTLADGSAALTASDPDRAVEGMRRVGETGRTALADMRRMLGLLGSSPGTQLTPQPGVGELPELLDSYRAAGLPISLTTSGSVRGDHTEHLVIYRIIQESLTNVLRHAIAPAWVRVDLRFEDNAILVTITNDGLASPVRDGGHGLLGMRERVALYGGSLETGPRREGGWKVAAILPHDTEGTARE